MTYDPRLTRTALVPRVAPEPGTPEANPATTLIEPKIKGLPRAEQPSRWAALPVLPSGDGRRSVSPRVVVPLPVRTRVVRRMVGEADRYAGGSVRGSAWNVGWRWWVQVAAGVLLGITGWALLIIGAAYLELL